MKASRPSEPPLPWARRPSAKSQAIRAVTPLWDVAATALPSRERPSPGGCVCLRTDSGLRRVHPNRMRNTDGTKVETTGRGGTIQRSDYLIDRFRVVFESGGGWHCACADFAASNACRHTREAAGRRAAQAQIKSRVAAARSMLTTPTRPLRGVPAPPVMVRRIQRIA